MIQDFQLTFSEAQAITTTAEADRYVDLLADGDAEPFNVTLNVSTDQLFASAGGTATLTITLYSSATADQDDVVLYQSPALTITQLNSLASDSPFVVNVQIPRGIRRFLGIEYTYGTEVFNAGHITAFLTYDVAQTNLNQ